MKIGFIFSSKDIHLDENIFIFLKASLNQWTKINTKHYSPSVGAIFVYNRYIFSDIILFKRPHGKRQSRYYFLINSFKYKRDNKETTKRFCLSSSYPINHIYFIETGRTTCVGSFLYFRKLYSLDEICNNRNVPISRIATGMDFFL